MRILTGTLSGPGNNNGDLGPPRGKAEWDARAPDFAKRTEASSYVAQMINRLNPLPTWTVLDVGSGPGTLAIPLAPLVHRVTCLDFSANMLSILQQRASAGHLDNLSTCKASWTDDWHPLGIEPHDLVIASRSLAVDNLEAALVKLTNFATRMVVVTDRVGPCPLDPGAFSAVGRELRTGPDYIFTVNLLHHMGIFAAVDFIRLDGRQTYPSLDEACARFAWMFNGLTPDENERLRRYVCSLVTLDDQGAVTIRPAYQPTWAYISWHPPTRTQNG